MASTVAQATVDELRTGAWYYVARAAAGDPPSTKELEQQRRRRQRQQQHEDSPAARADGNGDDETKGDDRAGGEPAIVHYMPHLHEKGISTEDGGHLIEALLRTGHIYDRVRNARGIDSEVAAIIVAEKNLYSEERLAEERRPALRERDETREYLKYFEEKVVNYLNARGTQEEREEKYRRGVITEDELHAVIPVDVLCKMDPHNPLAEKEWHKGTVVSVAHEGTRYEIQCDQGVKCNIPKSRIRRAEGDGPLPEGEFYKKDEDVEVLAAWPLKLNNETPAGYDNKGGLSEVRQGLDQTTEATEREEGVSNGVWWFDVARFMTLTNSMIFFDYHCTDA